MNMRAIDGPMLLLLIVATGCTGYDGGSHALEQSPVDFPTDALALELQPYLTVRCASLDCHGAKGRPLRLYAEDGLRLTAELREQLLTDEELILNLQSLRGLDPESPLSSSRVLLKPLSPKVGGMAHEGEVVWLGRDSAGYRCIEAFLAGDTEALRLDAGLRSTCAQAYLPWLPRE